MMRTKYTAEFKEEAVTQVIDKGHTVVDVDKQIGIAEGVLSVCVSKFNKADESHTSHFKLVQTEMAMLKGELRQTTEVCDILKKTAI